MSPASLQPGIVEAILSDSPALKNQQFHDSISTPTLQILSIKPIPVADGTPRVRLILSDGKHYMQAMLNTVLNSLALSDAPLLVTNSIVKITSYTVNKTKDKKIFLLLNLDRESVQPIGYKIGEPINIDKEIISSSNSGETSFSNTTATKSLSSNSGSVGNSHSGGVDSTISAFSSSNSASNYNKSSSIVNSCSNASMQSNNNNNSMNSSMSFQASSAAQSFNNPMNSTYSASRMSGNSVSSSSGSSSTTTTKLMVSAPESEAAIHQISSLTPYNNKWAIKARVTQKSEIKTWSNAKGEGKLFTMTLMDASGEIKCTAFKEAAETFHPRFEVGKVYLIGKGTVKMANAKYAPQASSSASSSASPYEMQLEKTSYASLVTDSSSDSSIPLVKYAFVPIKQAASLENNSIIDVIGVLKESSEASTIKSKTTQKQLVKRDITIVDLSGCSIKNTLWGEVAESFKVDPSSAPVVAFKGVRISEFNGKSLSTLSSTSIAVNPDIHEAYELRGWWEAQGFSMVPTCVSLSNATSTGESATALKDNSAANPYPPNEPRKPLSVLKGQIAASDRAAEYFSVTGCIGKIKHTNGISYASCPAAGCNKKVFELGPGQWKCEKCDQIYPNCNHRYMFSMCIQDYSGNVWVNVFDEAGSVIFGERKAEELALLRQNDEGAYEQIVRECQHKMARFRLRAKMEMWQGEQKMRYSLISVYPLSFEAECKAILGVIGQYAV